MSEEITGYGLGYKGLICDKCGNIIQRSKWHKHVKSHKSSGGGS